MTAEANNYLEQQRQEMVQRRDRLVQVFQELGLPVAIPEGSYFMIVDMERVKVDRLLFKPDEPNDFGVCRWLTQVIGVTAIPVSAFYENSSAIHFGKFWVRFCFCKSDATLDEAIRRLMELKKYLQ